jgi:hypothetical protein
VGETVGVGVAGTVVGTIVGVNIGAAIVKETSTYAVAEPEKVIRAWYVPGFNWSVCTLATTVSLAPGAIAPFSGVTVNHDAPSSVVLLAFQKSVCSPPFVTITDCWAGSTPVLAV